MTTYMLIFAAALAFAVGGTPVARWVAARTDIVDRPSGRKLHMEPIPLLGGAAIYAAFILALLLFGDRFYVSQLVGIFIGATLISFLGVWDDRETIRPLLKLAGQTAAALTLIVTGVRINLIPGDVVDIIITLVWVIGITNALNLLDNMDGLSGGVAAIAAGFFLLLAAVSGQFLVGSLAAALLGACLGFLRYNFNPAEVFMGDAGSLFLGFVLAAVGIKLRFPGNRPAVTWMTPVLVLGLPIFDTTLVVVSRLRRGVNPFTTAGKDHISHRVVARGWTHREAVMMLYLVACALGAAAIFVSQAGLREAYVVGACAVLAALYALWRLEWK
ncbi:MAG: putative undecaprenyl-phosphate N-acetylglucosaminyl 1-phosphate transferase [Anaerolineales bacterium]|nr:putative undecaprenyl-phosphate N-acetylglucosaminyl 1-phosphate transferase [Anaerolineales bacterium]